MQIKMFLCAAMKWHKVTILVCTLAIFSGLSLSVFAQEETPSEPLEDKSLQENSDEPAEINTAEGTEESTSENAVVTQTELQDAVNQETKETKADNQSRLSEQEAPVRAAQASRARPPSGQVVNLSSTIVGNQEQPQVLYIVPWKPVGDSDLENQNIQSQLDIIFGHVERVELRRELLYMEQFADVDDEAESN